MSDLFDELSSVPASSDTLRPFGRATCSEGCRRRKGEGSPAAPGFERRLHSQQGIASIRANSTKCRPCTFAWHGTSQEGSHARLSRRDDELTRTAIVKSGSTDGIAFSPSRKNKNLIRRSSAPVTPWRAAPLLMSHDAEGTKADLFGEGDSGSVTGMPESTEYCRLRKFDGTTLALTPPSSPDRSTKCRSILIVVGAGYIGLELGSWSGSGSGPKVTVSSNFCPKLLPDLLMAKSRRNALERILKKQEMEFHLETKVTGAMRFKMTRVERGWRSRRMGRSFQIRRR